MGRVTNWNKVKHPKVLSAKKDTVRMWIGNDYIKFNQVEEIKINHKKFKYFLMKSSCKHYEAVAKFKSKSFEFENISSINEIN